MMKRTIGLLFIMRYNRCIWVSLEKVASAIREVFMEELEYVLPKDIEKRSMEIIDRELRALGMTLKAENEKVIKRVIHTSADFEYAHTLKFSQGAVEKAKQLIRNGADIVTDTNMAMAGINKKKLADYGGEVHCFMADEDVAQEAGRRQITRAAVSMEKSLTISKPVIYVIGNAPTALIRLHELMAERQFVPEFIIGVPVGFVNVVYSKELFLGSKVPYIINQGRKGGSNVAAAICNAILYDL